MGRPMLLAESPIDSSASFARWHGAVYHHPLNSDLSFIHHLSNIAFPCSTRVRRPHSYSVCKCTSEMTWRFCRRADRATSATSSGGMHGGEAASVGGGEHY